MRRPSCAMSGVSSGADTSSATASGQESVNSTMMMPVVSKAERIPRAPRSLATVLCGEGGVCRRGAA